MGSVACGGLVTVDLLFHVPEFPQPGLKTRASDSRMAAGGGALIAASAVASLGGGAFLVGCIGDDMLGAFVRSELARQGVEGALLQTLPGVDTSRSAVLIGPDGDRTVINHRSNALFPVEITLLDPFPCGAALADTRWPGGGAALLRAARRAGRPAVLDAEAPVRLAEDAMAEASHIVFSEQGLLDYAGECSAAALAAVAQNLGKWVAVTRGAAPVLCHGAEGGFEVPTFPCTPVDTLGAGDTWHGAFALSLARGEDERDAVRFANAAASVKVSRAGGYPSAAAVKERLAPVAPGQA